MSSGIAVDDDVVDTFNAFKMGKKVKFVAFRISDDLKKIIVEKQGGSYDGPYSEFEEYLEQMQKEKQCRYACVYFHYTTQNDQPRTKILFMSYNTEEAPLKQKMVYTSSKLALRNKLEGADVEINGNDLDDIREAEILDHIRRKFKD